MTYKTSGRAQIMSSFGLATYLISISGPGHVELCYFFV